MNNSNSSAELPFRYSTGFKIASVLSGGFTAFVFLTLGTVSISDELENATAHCAAVFCMIAYLFLVISCETHQRNQRNTPRAVTYLALLALFPIWSLPVAFTVIGCIQIVAEHSLREGVIFVLPLVAVAIGLLSLIFAARARTARRKKPGRTPAAAERYDY